MKRVLFVDFLFANKMLRLQLSLFLFTWALDKHKYIEQHVFPPIHSSSYLMGYHLSCCYLKKSANC